MDMITNPQPHLGIVADLHAISICRHLFHGGRPAASRWCLILILTFEKGEDVKAWSSSV
jgi:hypothetical protein